MAPFLCYGQKAGRLGFAAQKQVFFLGVPGVQGQGMKECPPGDGPGGPSGAASHIRHQLGLSWEEVVECIGGLGLSISLHRQVPGFRLETLFPAGP